MGDDENWKRVKKSAKHFLAAVVFHESSRETSNKIESSLLPCMGYYYVGFHSAVAMLWLCRSVDTKSLKRLSHNQLKKLVEINLIQPKELDRNFLIEYKKLQDYREYANYRFGSKLPKYEYRQISASIAAAAGYMLEKSRNFVYAELVDMNMLFSFQTIIGDDIGTDLINLHCGPVIAKKVWKYLVEHELTT